jgi:hypothetical protein
MGKEFGIGTQQILKEIVHFTFEIFLFDLGLATTLLSYENRIF